MEGEGGERWKPPHGLGGRSFRVIQGSFGAYMPLSVASLGGRTHQTQCALLRAAGSHATAGGGLCFRAQSPRETPLVPPVVPLHPKGHGTSGMGAHFRRGWLKSHRFEVPQSGPSKASPLQGLKTRLF